MSVKHVHEGIIDKLNILLKCVEQQPNDHSDATIQDLIQLNREYRMNSCQYLILWLNNNNAIGRKEVYDVYECYLNYDNIIKNIDDIGGKIFANHSMPHLSHTFNNSRLTLDSFEEYEDKCDVCGVQFVIRPECSDQVCPDCGVIQRLEGTYFELENKNKSGPYKPSKHCEHHANCIFAQECTVIPDSLINDIRRCMRRDNIQPTMMLTCRKIREYLKDLKKAKYNVNVPKIRFILTGISPPKPTAARFKDICKYFDLADEIFMTIKPDNIHSRQYYPYRLRKIIEIVYYDDIKIRNAFIDGIHNQDEKTMITHNEMWEKICDNSGGRIPYIPTKKNLLQYR